MSLLVVGSIGIDTVETPHGGATDALGGSAIYFSVAASYFAQVRLVGVVGDDFPNHFADLLNSNPGIDTDGLVRQAGQTFRWKGRYSSDMNSRETLEVHLNVLATFDPDLPDHYRDSHFVFLANNSPVTQRKVLHQIRNPRFVMLDTMDLWIKTQHDELLQLLGEIDGIVLNDQEALLLTETDQLLLAGQKVLAMGPKFVVVKKGEHGSILFTQSGVVSLPAYPVGRLVDPTGAGDSFAGGMMGYLASLGTVDVGQFKKAMAYGTVSASITCEDFSLGRIAATGRDEIDGRFQQYRQMLVLE